tara:strand:+ start:2709 stop:2924 length:216 start_codon:yes stop_codon:yes gene_type:complete
MFKTIIFISLLINGQAERMEDESNDGRKLYTLTVDTPDTLFKYEHVYKEEIYQYIKTGKFEYNESLTDKNR